MEGKGEMHESKIAQMFQNQIARWIKLTLTEKNVTI